MAKPTIILLSLTFLSLLSLSSPLPSTAVLNAAEILSNSGFVSMALTLQLVSPTLTASQPRSATIFSPSDAAFADFGQPPLSLLLLHFSPVAISLESLQALPYGTQVPTMSAVKSLIVTTPDTNKEVSLNNVTISGSPIYDDGSLIVFGIDRFFDPNFEIPLPILSPSRNLGCVVWETTPISSLSSYSFDDASGTLRSRGYSVMASFLDLQLLGLVDQPNLTVFAPVDDVLLGLVGNFSDSSSIFRRHVVPCKLTWTDLTNLGDGATLRTFSDGFTIKIMKLNDQLMLNGVPVTFPDMYYSDWLVVHGLHQVLQEPAESPEQEVELSSEFLSEERIAPDRSEF